MSPCSDLDVVLLTRDGYDDRRRALLADRLWYPLWDAMLLSTTRFAPPASSGQPRSTTCAWLSECWTYAMSQVMLS